MPVHLESHTPELDIDPSTTKGRILAFLYQNPKFGYKPAEVQEELDIPHGTATTTLSRLLESDYIGKTPDSYYHALEERTDLKRYASSYEQVTRLNELYGEEPSVEARQTKPREDQLEELSESDPSKETIESELDALESEIGSDGNQ